MLVKVFIKVGALQEVYQMQVKKLNYLKNINMILLQLQVVVGVVILKPIPMSQQIHNIISHYLKLRKKNMLKNVN
ncbi:hypothetical protein B9K06_26060 [Bacillus sp. OG2]|nr:hypothetical protein B9K06_26060 [Bacillus sp. OG2]